MSLPKKAEELLVLMRCHGGLVSLHSSYFCHVYSGTSLSVCANIVIRVGADGILPSQVGEALL